MTKNNPPDDASSLADEELVAYLDGELDAAAGRRVEALLATDAKLRRRLQSLERTWELLDELETVPSGGALTHTTLEMVALAAGEEVEREKSAAPRRRRLRRLKIVFGLIAAAAAGFAAAAAFAPDPNRRLLADLPVLERFDEYRHAESVEYLRLLRDAGLFVSAAETAKAAAPSSIEERRRRVAKMSPEEKEQLRLARERFDDLTEDGRQEMRKLRAQLREAPDLQAVMQRYGDWLRGLSIYNRASLGEMKPAERIEWIKKRLLLEKHRRIVAPLGGEDLKELRQWSGEHAKKHYKRYLESLSEAQQKRLAELDSRTARWMVYEQMLQRWWAADVEKPLPMMNDEEIERLGERLSAEARERLLSVPAPMRWKLAAGWLRCGPRRPQLPHGAATKDDDRLLRFFEEELDGEQRDRLLGMSVEDMQRELRRLFLMHDKSRHGPRRRQGGPNSGDWPPPKKPKPPGQK
ncbi:MAG: hypothetical protein JW959_03710 [Pirellulales bacterium]|nr:hypothetical protein [Pirellulales bacterium]